MIISAMNTLLLQYNIPNLCPGVDSVAVRDNTCLFLDKMSDGPPLQRHYKVSDGDSSDGRI